MSKHINFQKYCSALLNPNWSSVNFWQLRTDICNKHAQVINMKFEIKTFDNKEHRDQVIDIWTSIFNYKDKRNDPSLVIDKKLAVNDNLFYIALENDKIVGTIMAGYDGHRGWIYSLAVLPEKRRAKIGTKLLRHAESELKKLGCLKINLQIMKDNEVVKEFYLKNGYAIEDRISMGKEIPENIR